MMDILLPVIVLLGIAVVFGSLLAVASKKFAVEVDNRVEMVRACLPGANCGACGFPGCDGLASAVVEGKADVNACTVGGQNVAESIAEIMGKNAVPTVPQSAYVLCNGSIGNTREVYEYQGLDQCAAAVLFAGGPKSCRFACIGFGDCAKACKFGAISIVNGKSNINPEKCVACGACAKACPKQVIELSHKGIPVLVACRNSDPGKSVREVCTRGCIGCKKCERNCEYDAIHVIDGFAHVDYSKCTGCGKCAEGCPTHCIAGGKRENWRPLTPDPVVA